MLSRVKTLINTIQINQYFKRNLLMFIIFSSSFSLSKSKACYIVHCTLCSLKRFRFSCLSHYMYALYIYPSVHKQLIRTLLEAHCTINLKFKCLEVQFRKKVNNFCRQNIFCFCVSTCKKFNQIIDNKKVSILPLIENQSKRNNVNQY